MKTGKVDQSIDAFDRALESIPEIPVLIGEESVQSGYGGLLTRAPEGFFPKKEPWDDTRGGPVRNEPIHPIAGSLVCITRL